MTARRILVGLVLLLAGATGTACAEVVPGTGTVAADAQTGGGGRTGAPAPSPTDGGTGSSPPPSSPPSASGPAGSSPVCEALDEAAVEQAFGAEVTFGRSQSSGCQIRADDGRSMILAVFDYLKLSEYKRDGSTDLTIGGHPAVRTSATIVYLARAMDPEVPGLIAAYFSGLGDGGEPIAVRVLELLLPKYSK